MGRYFSAYKHQEVKNYGDGFKGLSNSGNRPDGAIRWDLEDDKITGYKASWNETGAGGKGWNLSKIEWLGKFTYSANGQLTNLAVDRITTKHYGYYKPTNSDMQQAYSMAYSPRFSFALGSIDNVYKKTEQTLSESALLVSCLTFYTTIYQSISKYSQV